MGRSRRLAGLAMAAGMMGSMAVPVMAAEVTPSSNIGTMTVGYTEPSTYTLSIPESVTLKEDAVVSESVGLSNVNVGTKQEVQIKVTEGVTEGNVKLTDVKDSSNIKTSKVSLDSDGKGIAVGDVVATFDGASATNPIAKTGGTLYFSKLGDIPAGTYTGTITFEASIVDITPAS